MVKINLSYLKYIIFGLGVFIILYMIIGTTFFNMKFTTQDKSLSFTLWNIFIITSSIAVIIDFIEKNPKILKLTLFTTIIFVILLIVIVAVQLKLDLIKIYKSFTVKGLYEIEVAYGTTPSNLELIIYLLVSFVPVTIILFFMLFVILEWIVQQIQKFKPTPISATILILVGLFVLVIITIDSHTRTLIDVLNASPLDYVFAYFIAQLVFKLWNKKLYH